uniref:Uncharacterized protein n=1 Tax=Anopheles maculatus TaxID=74869 RepID=A0A182SQT3_9DIPT
MTAGESPTKSTVRLATTNASHHSNSSVGGASATTGIGGSGSGGTAITKQWWKVCFLYGGNQEKYYRQIYGKAASERLAAASAKQMTSEGTLGDSNERAGNCNANASLVTGKTIPTLSTKKLSSSTQCRASLSANGSASPALEDGFRFRKGSPVIKSSSSRSSLAMPTVPGSSERSPCPNPPVGILRKRVTVLDDSFLLGNNVELLGSELEAEVDEQRSDSGINVDARQPSPQVTGEEQQRLACHRPGMRRTFHLSGEELRLLNFDHEQDTAGSLAYAVSNGTSSMAAIPAHKQQISAASNPSTSSSSSSSTVTATSSSLSKTSTGSLMRRPLLNAPGNAGGSLAGTPITTGASVAVSSNNE